MLAVPSTASPAEKINRPPPLLLGTLPSPGAASAARARPFTLVSVTSSVHAGPNAPPKSACIAANYERDECYGAAARHRSWRREGGDMLAAKAHDK